MTAFGCDWEVTVVQIWANFCLLCRQEHPALEDFFENPCGADSPQALTFNTGDDVSKVASYMREKYKFPVIVNGELALRIFQTGGGVPQAFVSGPDGRRTEFFKSWTFGRCSDGSTSRPLTAYRLSFALFGDVGNRRDGESFYNNAT